jgi:hypothetical protein
MREEITVRRDLWVGLPLVWFLLVIPTMAGDVLAVFDENANGYVVNGMVAPRLDSFYPLREPISGIPTLARLSTMG